MSTGEVFDCTRPADVLTADEAAARLRVDAKTVRREVRRGRLRACYVGTRIRITEAALQEYLDTDGGTR